MSFPFSRRSLPYGARTAFALLACCPCAMLRAQPADSSRLAALQPGSVVRVQPAAGARWRVGRIVTRVGDTLWLARPGSKLSSPGRPVVAPPDRARVEVDPDYDVVDRRRDMLVLGSVAGGIVYGVAVSGDDYAEYVGVIVGGFLGALVGSVLAERLHPHRWDPVYP